MDFVPPLTEEEASYWVQVVDRLSPDEKAGVENLPPEVPKLFTLGVMRTFPKAKGDKLVKLVVKAIRKSFKVTKCCTIYHTVECEETIKEGSSTSKITSEI